MAEKFRIIENHVKEIQTFYGEVKGVWYSRKPLLVMLKFQKFEGILRAFNEETEGPAQIDLTQVVFCKSG